MRKVFFVIAMLAVLFAVACKKEVKEEAPQEEVAMWNVYSYPEYNAKVYLKLEDGKLNAIVCGSANKIVGRVNMSHDCTEDEFATIQKKILEHGITEEEKVKEPLIDGYPDMTAYLPFILDEEKQEDIWDALVEK